ncbi:MAG: hypothetical protein FJ284_02600 [Planctomycetes bacterium]|nr:hypothetical protein [Planctomycetota bacterium]
MKAIVHIGDMKCGSKSIQHWLHQDAAVLRELGFHGSTTTRFDIYDSRLASYAIEDESLANEPRRESGIVSAADVPAHRDEIERGLAAEVAALPADARALVFSHEMLLSLEPAEVDRLVGLLRGLFDEIGVVAYIRRQDKLFLSLWGQRLKTHDPGPGFCECLRDKRSYLRMLDTWERAVGRGRLAVRVFDKLAFRQVDIQADFRAAAGIPADPRFTRPALRNEGLDAAAQSLLLALRDRLVDRRERARRSLAARLRRIFGGRRSRPWESVAFPRPLVTHLMRNRPGSGLMPSRSWAREIVAGCAAENEIIRARYFPDRAVLFDDDFSAYPDEGGPPGRAVPPCDTLTLRQPDCAAADPEHVEEAYRLVLGRDPGPEERATARRGAANIAEVYAMLLNRVA